MDITDFTLVNLKRKRTTPDQMLKHFLADYMKITRNELDAFMSGELELTDDMAAGLSEIFSSTKQFWLNVAAASKRSETDDSK